MLKSQSTALTEFLRNSEQFPINERGGGICPPPDLLGLINFSCQKEIKTIDFSPQIFPAQFYLDYALTTLVTVFDILYNLGKRIVLSKLVNISILL